MCDWKVLFPVWFTMQLVDYSDDALQAIVPKWLGAEPKVDVE